jgi:hypothetical protein
MEKVGVSDSASVLVTPVCSGYIGALTKPESFVSDKVESSSSGSSAMAAAMQHANTAPAFLAAWNAAPDDNAMQALEQVALMHGTTAVRIEALLNRDERSRADMAALQASLNAATAAVNAANANAQAAQAVALAFKPNPPPRYGNKDKDMEIRKWLPIVEDYARTCADGDYCVLSAPICMANRGRTSSRSMMLTRLPTKEPSRLIPGSFFVRP